MAKNMIANFFVVISILCLIVQGAVGQCTKANLTITQNATGKQVEGKPEWQATLKNGCSCVFLDVVLACEGFQTAEKIDPSILTIKGGGECVVNDQKPIGPMSSLSFNYAWDSSFPFSLKNAQVACS